MDVFAKLPPHLQYLIGPAKKYGRHQFDGRIAEFLDQATNAELDELASIAERFRLNRHAVEFNEFLDRFEITEHEQSALLYFLFAVIDTAGFDISDPDWNTFESYMASLQRFGSYRLASERAKAARFLVDFAHEAHAAIPLLQNACSDEDERVRVWAHYALAKIQGSPTTHIDAIRTIFASHNELDEFELYDDVGGEAEVALELLTDSAS